jgi:hypothetical protein
MSRDGALVETGPTALSSATSRRRGEQQVVQCMVSVELPDGQLTFQGLAEGLDNTFALTGGTGAYRNAQGEPSSTTASSSKRPRSRSRSSAEREREETNDVREGKTA